MLIDDNTKCTLIFILTDNNLNDLFKVMSDNLFLGKEELKDLANLNFLEADCFYRRIDIKPIKISKRSIISMDEFTSFLSKENDIPIKRYVA